MSDIPETSAPPAAASDSLLNKLVQEHLTRAGVAAEAPVEGSAPAQVDAELSPADLAAALEQMDPKSDTTGSVAAPQEAAPDPATASISAAELDALLSSDAQALIDNETESMLPDAAVPLPVDVPSEINQADGVLAEEISKLMETGASEEVQPAATPETPSPREQPTVAQCGTSENVAFSATVAIDPAAGMGKAPVAFEAVSSATAPPEAPRQVETTAVAPESAKAPAAGKGRSVGKSLVAILRDVLLMIAQVLDLPFMKLSEETKKLIAFAGLVMLSSGVVLVVVGLLHR
jgi:hypothetical protein